MHTSAALHPAKRALGSLSWPPHMLQVPCVLISHIFFSGAVPSQTAAVQRERVRGACFARAKASLCAPKPALEVSETLILEKAARCPCPNAASNAPRSWTFNRERGLEITQACPKSGNPKIEYDVPFSRSSVKLYPKWNPGKWKRPESAVHLVGYF